jgi:regulator of RNase E activity RraB
VLIGKVNYRGYKGSDGRFAANGVDRVFHKRIAFGDEKELRLLARHQLNDLDMEVSETGDIDMELEADSGFNLKVAPDDLIKRIILPPDVNERQLTQVVQLMEYHDITADIWRSMLDVSPDTTAPIQVTGDDAGRIARDNMEHARLVDKSKYK